MVLSSIGLTLTACILLINAELTLCTVFLDQSSAGQILRSSSSSSSRRRRANSFLEEMLPANLERECYEESCSQEEAKEIFQTQEKTLEFWYRYKNMNHCEFNPCMNGGICTLDRGELLCLCPPQYRGKICESMVLECNFKNGGCMQYCRDLPGGAGVVCGCAEGFTLEPDGQSCASTASFPCGRQQMHMLYRGRSLLDDYEWDNVTMGTDGNITDSWELNLETEEERTTVNATLKQTEEERTTVNSTLKQREEERTTVNSTLKQREEERTTVNATLTPRQRHGTGLVGGEEGGEVAEGEEEERTRIVGGVLERAGGSPWQVLIRRPDGYGFCGGTLVSDRWIISAAHCFEESAAYVTIGDYDKRRPDPGEQQIKIQKVFVHPHFHAYTFDSDIALVYLAQPIVRGPTAIPACLPDPHLSKYLVQEDNRGVVTGFGLTRFMGRSSRFLRKVALPVVSYRACTMSTEQVITDNMFCAGYLDTSMDACSGDSGGPFVVNYRGTWFLTGVVSWGEKCAAKGKYGVYTRLGNFLSWIRDTMERQDLNSTSS